MPPRAQPTDPAKLLPPILRHLSSSPPDAYSAHQKARTTAARLVHSSHGAEAIEVLFGSAKELLKVKEYGSGCDLGVYMIQVYISEEVDVDEESKAKVTQLLALLDGEGAWRKKLADIAIKWSAEEGEYPTGDPDLHQYIGNLYYKDRQFQQAEPHLINSLKKDAAVTLAEMMYEWSDHGKSDPGRFAARVVLPYLSIKPPAIFPAKAFLSHFLHLLQSTTPPALQSLPTPTSLTTTSSPETELEIQTTSNSTLNFLQLAILTVQRAPKEGVSGIQARGTTGGVGREWENLVRRFRGPVGSAMADQAVQEAIQHISTTLFLIPPPRNQAAGADMLQNLMGSLFAGGGGGR